jgi:hypothetical protein
MHEELSWADIVDAPAEPLEFGACHVHQAWRRHKTRQQKFLGLQAAFVTSEHRLPRLLQSVESNCNARNHTERGQAIFAAVWSSNASWAILCDATQAVLIPRNCLETIAENKVRDDDLVGVLRCLLERSPPSRKTPLDETVYERVLAASRRQQSR